MQLQEQYKKQIVPELKKQFGFKNIFEVPRIEKVVINVGFGRNTKDKQYIKAVNDGLTRITGQKPTLNKARQSISAFKIREGNIVGASVTLRGKRMYEFLEKLVHVSFPRIRDFRGISNKGIDNMGNLTVGFKEHTPFPEIKADAVENVFGLEICLPTSAKNREEGLALFTLLGFPFKKDKK